MRDPERIPRVLEELQKLWLQNPDFRLFQLLIAIVGSKISIFNLEDDKLLELITKYRTKKENRQ